MIVSIFYLLAQMVGAGTLVALLLGVDSEAVKNIVIVGVGDAGARGGNTHDVPHGQRRAAQARQPAQRPGR